MHNPEIDLYAKIVGNCALTYEIADPHTAEFTIGTRNGNLIHLTIDHDRIHELITQATHALNQLNQRQDTNQTNPTPTPAA
ncbi:hypothetical protein [Actinokineospora inagensis]|uniref:hypothetical protein n=1 Tax=Actinokineospora inagensis TaxID=103730 RepID=UPI00041D213E|nr:hypothetical protein [Actinokineospora inagensis]